MRKIWLHKENINCRDVLQEIDRPVFDVYNVLEIETFLVWIPRHCSSCCRCGSVDLLDPNSVIQLRYEAEHD